jgi:hypothetical protein
VPYSNIQVYEDIVHEAYSEMNSIIENGRTAKDDGSGYIIQYDSTQASFKKSMVVVVFAGMWLEATFHQFMVSNHSKSQFTKHNSDSYRNKLELMGIKEPDFLAKTKKFQKTRNELIHEKAFMDKGDLKGSQNEAKTAHEIISHVSLHFKKKG